MPDPVSPLGVSGQNQTLTHTRIVAAALQAAGEGTAAPGPAHATVSIPGAPDGVQLSTAPQAGQEPAPMTLVEATETFREYLENLPSNLKFQPDKESGLVIFKVVNPVTQEVIRQYPPEEVIRMARYLKAAARQGNSGIFLDKKL